MNDSRYGFTFSMNDAMYLFSLLWVNQIDTSTWFFSMAAMLSYTMRQIETEKTYKFKVSWAFKNCFARPQTR